jgi:hypothetical protein
MTKTAVQTQFDELIRHVLWPPFKARGYHKTGSNFRWYDPAGWGKIVNVQKSQYGDRDHVSFTLNTGLYLPEAERLWTGRATNERFLEPNCLIRQRVSQLKTPGADVWYDLTIDTDPQRLAHEVAQDLTAHLLPYMDRVSSRQAVLQQLLRERRPNSPLAIETAYVCGHPAEAHAWMAHEIATTLYRSQREPLEQLQRRLRSLEVSVR